MDPNIQQKVAKREEFLSWDDYFMAVVNFFSCFLKFKFELLFKAFLSSQRSKDPSTQVGACIVNQEKKIVGIGYNGYFEN